MRICVFDVMDYEWEFFNQYPNATGYKEALNEKTIELVHGYDAISINTHTELNAKMIDELKKRGVMHISTRTVGYEHIDIEHAKKLDVCVYSSSIDSKGVSSFTIMQILSLIRKLPISQNNIKNKDFSLDGLCGRDLSSMVVGVIGAGRIGSRVIKLLSAFGTKVLVYDRSTSLKIPYECEFCDIDELLKKSDIITLHMPLNKENYHIINSQSIEKMKDGVFIINNSRGGLLNTTDVCNALEKGKIAGLAIDVLEEEAEFIHKKNVDCAHSIDVLERLAKFDNVLYTPHCAFYTAETVRSLFDEAMDFTREPIKS